MSYQTLLNHLSRGISVGVVGSEEDDDDDELDDELESDIQYIGVEHVTHSVRGLKLEQS